MDGGDQRVGRERLSERGVRPEALRRLQHIAAERAGDGENLDGGILLPNIANGLDPLALWHREIRHEQITRGVRRDERDGLAAVRCREDPKMLLRQHAGDEFHDRRMIIGDHARPKRRRHVWLFAIRKS
jgi:hypothetical protein